MVYKNNQGSTKEKNGKCLPLRGLFGVGMLFVIASIAVSSYLVLAGTDNRVFWVLITPQVIFATVILIHLSYNK